MVNNRVLTNEVIKIQKLKIFLHNHFYTEFILNRFSELLKSRLNAIIVERNGYKYAAYISDVKNYDSLAHYDIVNKIVKELIDSNMSEKLNNFISSDNFYINFFKNVSNISLLYNLTTNLKDAIIITL